MTFYGFVTVPVSSVNLQNISSSDKELKVIEGEEITLTCVTGSCRPAASVFWKIGEDNYTSLSTVSVKIGRAHV